MVRTILYAIARTLGDLNAVRRGPTAVVRRIARRGYGKGTGRLARTLFG